MSFVHRAGVFVVRYDTPEALSPAAQGDLVAALRKTSLLQPLGIMFVVSPSVQWVSHEVPSYWTELTKDRTMRIAAIAVVTTNPAVVVATRGFSTSQILGNTSVTVRPFSDETEAVAWVTAAVVAARSQPGPGGAR
ncbi:hypothetical protein [Anaeromyxobacter oryzisoli]|uniref:hypothetical protein n=1 Tax=Anaeromyxobacter oryzisoli TaxID=2925408 RepID=UPI001F55DB30|nr:hypothetical protein [Anaeromyxobacter sp. SG63]